VTVRSLDDPDHRTALAALEAALERGDLVTVFGRCAVEYDGRTASSLGDGERLLVLKPDGSALVHTDEKRTPVNWQPPGCDHSAAVRDGRLRVHSERSSPAETLDVRFGTVRHLAAMGVTGRREVDPVGSESDLRRAILADPSLVEAGFEPLETERETAAGPMDVFGTDSEGRPVVVELKRRRVGPGAAGQLGRYVDALERELVDGEPVRGILVAPSVTDAAAELLDERGFEHVAVDLDEVEVPDADGDAADGGHGNGERAAR